MPKDAFSQEESAHVGADDVSRTLEGVRDWIRNGDRGSSWGKPRSRRQDESGNKDGGKFVTSESSAAFSFAESIFGIWIALTLFLILCSLYRRRHRSQPHAAEIDASELNQTERYSLPSSETFFARHSPMRPVASANGIHTLNGNFGHTLPPTMLSATRSFKNVMHGAAESVTRKGARRIPALGGRASTLPLAQVKASNNRRRKTTPGSSPPGQSPQKLGPSSVYCPASMRQSLVPRHDGGDVRSSLKTLSTSVDRSRVANVKRVIFTHRGYDRSLSLRTTSNRELPISLPASKSPRRGPSDLSPRRGPRNIQALGQGVNLDQDDEACILMRSESTVFSQVPSQPNALDAEQLERCNELQGFASIPAAPPLPRILKPLKLETMMELIKARRSELAMLANLARTLGKDHTWYNQYSRNTDFEANHCDKSLLYDTKLQQFKTMALGEGSMPTAAQLIGGVRPKALIQGWVHNPDAAAFLFCMLLATVFSAVGPNLYQIAGPAFQGSDTSFYMVMFCILLISCIELVYYTLFKPGYAASFYFGLDVVVILSISVDAFVFFYPSGYDAWTDWVGFQVSLILMRTVRVLKIYSLLSRGSKAAKQKIGFSRDTVIGKHINTAIRQKVVLLLSVTLLLEGLSTVFGGRLTGDSTIGMDYYGMWRRKFHSSNLRELEIMLKLSGKDVRAEPFNRYIHQIMGELSCKDGVIYSGSTPHFDKPGFAVRPVWGILEETGLPDGPGGTRGGRWCHVSRACQWPDADLLSVKDTIGCRVRYIRVMGLDIFGQGPSLQSWQSDLRNFPPERFVATLADAKNESCPQPQLLNMTAPVKRPVSDQGTWHQRNDPVNGDPCSMLVLESRQTGKTLAERGLVTVLFMAFLLLYSNYLLVSLIDEELVKPVLEMVETVQEIATNPMAKLHMKVFNKGSSETRTVGQALFKLSNLLQIAFGEAGSHVIKVNMVDGSEMNAMVPGQRKTMIFGFCDIRNFTDCTESLQEGVMLFVNEIADYVHRSVVENKGLPNKNVGDAFQLAWAVPERDVSSRMSAKKSASQVHVGDCALRSILRIIIETATCPRLLRFTANEDLQNKIPGYVTRFGFGLHAGWAIQGAIGSLYKIDPSWLSPHVKWAERLESATKYYSVSILMTDAFRQHLSPAVQRLVRRIALDETRQQPQVDRIKVPDTPYPIDLYTYDIHPWRIDDPEGEQHNFHEAVIPYRYGNGPSFFEQFPPFHRPEWRNEFQLGVTQYIAGDWAQALVTLSECLVEEPQDVPAMRIIELIQELGKGSGAREGVQAPPSWKGARETVDI